MKFFFLIALVTLVLVHANDDRYLCEKLGGGVCIDHYAGCPFEGGTDARHVCGDPYDVCCYPPSRRERKYRRTRTCGYSRNSDFNKIVDGRPAKEHEWPWQVSIQNIYTGEHFCGGSILNEYWILTAAHCFVKETPQDILIRAGSIDQLDDLAQDMEVELIIKHEEYRYDYAWANDIALVKLMDPLEMNAAVSEVCLPYPDEEFEDMVCYVTGFGNLKEKGHSSRYLMEVALPTINNTLCQELYCHKDDVLSTNICSGILYGGRDACQGDSGGPMVCGKFDKYKEFKYVLAGLTSWGTGCARPGKPGVYTRVSDYIDWIYHHTDEDPSPAPMPYDLYSYHSICPLADDEVKKK